ncbi:MAG: zinc finger Ran-binding domain-containing protein [Actinobacteria bacterium]|nr:zinc finger Ran-binding domain-containing protein [Actinomycetota bacterium]
MDEELYRLVSTGLLGLIVLLLVLVIARLGKLQHDRGSAAPELSRDDTDADQTAATQRDVVDPSAAPLPAGAEQALADSEGGGDEGPYERDGRWWYRQDGDLLVYDERLEQWVDPNATEQPAKEGAAAEPRDAGERATPETVGVAVSDGPSDDAEPHPLDEARGWDTTPVTDAPVPEPVSPPQPMTEPPAEPDAMDVGMHWKCPACGVINGSTATTCRMCFAARP